MISLTDKAVAKFKVLRVDDGGKTTLRIAIKGGGCTGLTYSLSWVLPTEVSLQDHVFSNDGLVYAVDPKSMLFIKGTTIDFIDGLEGSGFVYSNPNSTRQCGCGSSFKCG